MGSAFRVTHCECSNNMLYPKEDSLNKQLLMACHNCDHQEDATDMCVYRNLIRHSVQYESQTYSYMNHNTTQHIIALTFPISFTHTLAKNPFLFSSINTLHSEKTTVVHDVSSDPTLPRTRGTRCAKCGNREAVFFQAPGGRDEGMTLFFVCCNQQCGNRWTE